MRVLGIDPSYTSTGLVVLEGAFPSQCKVITSRKMAVPMGTGRMLRAGKGIHTFIQSVSINSAHFDLAFLEDAAYGAPSRIVVAKLKELSGVYKFILEAHDLEWHEISPSAVKRRVVGEGHAEKKRVAARLAKKWGIRFAEDGGYDLSDAAAVAIAGWQEWLEKGGKNRFQKNRLPKDAA